MAVLIPVDTVDEEIEPIRDVVTMHKMLAGRTRLVVGGAEYISPVASSAANLRAVLSHIRRTDRAQILVDLAKQRTMLLPTDTASGTTGTRK